MEIRPVVLYMVTGNNNNKFYKMTPHGDTFSVEYGRVGSSVQHASYPISQWNKKYNEKVRKGYVDQTHLVEDLIEEVSDGENSEYKDIENKSIAEIVKRLQEMARQKVQSNYRVSSNKVTQAMVDEAQNVIDSLVKIEELKQFNDTLLKLFTVIPRKMGNVNDYLATTKDDFAKILQDEQNLLDVMRGQVVTNIATKHKDEKTETTTKKDKTILDSMGLIFEEADAKDIEIVKENLQEYKDKLYRVWRVTNVETQKRFDAFVEKENIKTKKLFWHGSRNENWWSIICNGLMIRPTNAVYTGSMFGDAIYSSNCARKSMGYTSYSGSYWARGNSTSAFMALMETAYGKPYDVHSHDYKYYSYNYSRLQNDCPGANCLHARRGSMLRNDEIVFYNKEQLTIKYLVELR